MLDQVEYAIPGPDAFPEVGGSEALPRRRVAWLALRIWASLVLGSFYTRTLRTTAEQRLIVEGPYRLIRNPGYLGDIFLLLGAGMATANWIVLYA